METKEIWVEMWDFPTYEVSNTGKVRNAKTGRELKVKSDGENYRVVSLWYQGKKYTKRTARLVWNSFNQQYCSKTVDHIDRNGSNDNINNLRCVSMKENRNNREKITTRNKYNLTPELKGHICREIISGRETTWTIMKKYGIPTKYTQTMMKRGTWNKYV
jgi:hypothetical protein